MAAGLQYRIWMEQQPMVFLSCGTSDCVLSTVLSDLGMGSEAV